jgi:hypothetical protein
LATSGVTTGAAAPTNSTIVLLLEFGAQTFPEPSMARLTGNCSPPWYPDEPEMGVPLELNSLMLVLSPFVVQIFPTPSMARL